jgi:guanine deaminase
MSIENLFKGSVFHTPKDGILEYLEDALICVNQEGIIEKVVTKDQSL